MNIKKYFEDKAAGTATLSKVQADFPEAAYVIVARVAYNEQGVRADQVEYMTLADYQNMAAFVAEVEALL